MNQVNAGLAKASINSVSKSASSAKTAAGGLKSNNGIENSVSAIKGKEKSEEILEAMFAFGIEHAQEFAQRELDDDLRWWKRMGDRTMIENMSAQQNAAGSQIGAGIAAAGLAGIIGGIATLSSNNNADNIHKNEEINQEGQVHSQQNSVAQNEPGAWQNQNFQIKGATDPESVFG